MVRTNNSDIQSTNPQHPADCHALPSLDRQSSILSLLDVFQHTFSDDIESSGSMSIDELLSNFFTEEEIQTFQQTLLPNPDIALSTAAPVEAATVPTIAATVNINPQFPEGEIKTSTVNDTIQQSLQGRGSLTLPSPESQKTMDEVWYEMQKLQEEQVHGSASDFQATDEVMNLEDVLIMTGVVRAHDHSPPLQQSCVSYTNNNNTILGSGTPGCMVRPVIASGGGGNVPAYQPLLERSVKDAASAAVARKPSGSQPLEFGHGGKMQGSPASPISSDSVWENQSDSMKNLDMDVNAADRSNGPTAKVVSGKQRRRIKNKESAARSRARRQAYTHNMEARLDFLKEANARLQREMEEVKKMKQQSLEEFMEARKGKDGKKGLKRSWSWLY